MRLSFGVIAAVLVLGVLAEGAPQSLWDRVKGAARDSYRFTKGAAQGTRDMYRAYTDMREANYKNSDKYFHSRGNYDAARRGSGGAWAARVISNARERLDQIRGGSAAQSAADQEANRWGRNGGNPNRYRPKGLPSQYKK